jgi:Mg-chelatase subunit ChlD
MYSWQRRLLLTCVYVAGTFFLSSFGATIFTNTKTEKLGPAAFGATVFTNRTIEKVGTSAAGDTDKVTVTMYAEGKYDTLREYDTLYDTAYTYDTLFDTAYTYDTLYDTAYTYDTLYDTAVTYDTLYDTTRKPIDVVLGLDLSTSMAGIDSTIDPQKRTRIVWTKLAALHFLDSLKPGDRVAVMGWTSAANGTNIADTSNNRRYFHKWCDFTTDFNIVRSFIRDSIFIDNTQRVVDTVEGQILVVQDNIPNATFMYTPLRISTVVTAKHLSGLGRPEATRAVIMLTDGSNNDNLAQSVPVALLDSLHRTKGQLYYAIGFVAGDTAELRTLTSAGGGTYYHASNLSELDSAYGALAEQLISEKFDTTVSTTTKFDTTVSTTTKFDTTVSTTTTLDTNISTTPTLDTNISTKPIKVVQDTVVRGLDAILLFDKSGSMSGAPIAAAKQAGHDFVGMLGDSDRVAILSFADGYSPVADFTPYTQFSTALAAMDAMYASGSTALWYSSQKSMEYTLMNMRPKAQPVLIILTDGGDNASGSVTFDSLMRFLTPLGYKIPVFTISLGSLTNESQLQAIATSTGGAYYKTPTADSLSAIYKDIAKIIVNNVGARSVRIVESVPPAYTYITGSQAAGPANMTFFDSMYAVTGTGGTTLTWTAPVLSVWDTLQALYRVFVPAANAGDTLGNTIVSDISYEDNEYQNHEIVYGHAPPAAPSLISPAFYAYDIPVRPTLFWNKSCIGQTYSVMVSLASNFSSSVANVSGITDTNYTLGVTLSNLTRYYWRVNSSNQFGTSAWSDVWNFSTVVAPPGVPTLSSPANGAVNASLNTTLQWNAPATGGAPSSYETQFATDSTFVSMFGSQVFDTIVGSTTRYSYASGLSGNTTYYWRVRAINAGGTGAWSVVRYFTTVPQLPDVPTLALPADASIDQPITGITLSWTAAARAVTYRVQVSTVSTFSSVLYNTTVSAPVVSLTLGTTAYQTTYYWRVYATNAGGSSAWSAVWSFTTVTQPPVVPVLASPANASIDQPINGLALSWNAVAWAATYHVQVSTASDFSTTRSDTTVAAPAVSLTMSGMDNLTTYYWRVNSANSGGTSAWSSVWSYTTVITAPGAAGLASPADGATNMVLNPTFVWTAPVMGPTPGTPSGTPSWYLVQVSIDTTFAAPVSEGCVWAPATTWTASGLSTSTTYYWRVNTVNAGGSTWSMVRSFTTVKGLLIPIAAGWNMISLNIHPVDSAAAMILGPLASKEFILTKNDFGEVYCPSLFIDDIGAVRTGKGYQVYSGAADTIRADGSAVNAAASPLSLPSGWSMIGYLPQSDMPIVSALAGISTQILIVKGNDGKAYLPDYFIDDIGNMRVGAGYQVFMKAAAVLTYPAFAPIPKAVEGAQTMMTLPGPRHYVFNLNTGNNLSLVASRITIQGRPAPDSSEIGAFDSRGKLVGAGSVLRGRSALAVWGDDPQSKEKEGCGPSEKITFKLWDGQREYPLDLLQCSAEPRYSADGILIGAFSVPEAFFITRFALSKAYPNPFRTGGSLKLEFDVPMMAGMAEQAVEINIYDLKGNLVQRLAKDNYKAGHYGIVWDNAAGNDGKFSSNVFIIQMRARNFDKKIKVFRIR